MARVDQFIALTEATVIALASYIMIYVQTYDSLPDTTTPITIRHNAIKHHLHTIDQASFTKLGKLFQDTDDCKLRHATCQPSISVNTHQASQQLVKTIQSHVNAKNLTAIDSNSTHAIAVLPVAAIFSCCMANAFHKRRQRGTQSTKKLKLLLTGLTTYLKQV